MAETTRTPSGTPNQTTSTSTSPGSAPSGGARTGTNPSSTAAASPAATTTPSATAGVTPASRPSAAASSGSQGGNQNQAQRSSAQGQQNQGQQRTQNQGQQNQGQPNQGQRNQGQSTQDRRRDVQGDRGEEEYHVEFSGNPMSDAKKVGSELVGAARESAMSLVEAQRDRVADQIALVGEALRQSTESLESTGIGALAQYANQAADQICGFADTLRDRSWSELAGDLESFARRHPLTFMASAMGLGFIAGRFLLSSSERTHASTSGGAGISGVRTAEMRGDFGGTSRAVPSGARAEYGSTGIRE